MSVKKFNLLRWWDTFWFATKPTPALDIFRIALGVLYLLLFASLYPNWNRVYGPDGVYPWTSWIETVSPHTVSLFSLSAEPWLAWLIFWLGVVAALAFLVGYKTRWATIALYVVSVSMFYRNIYWVSGQDSLTTMLLFFGIFSPLGAQYSVDSWQAGIKPPRESSVWALRMMQISVALMYLSTAWIKYTHGPGWRDGTEIYYLSLSEHWFRFNDVSLFRTWLVTTALSWGTLVAEFAFLPLVWWRPLRPYILLAMAGLHISLMIFMRSGTFFFNLAALIALLLFVDSTFLSAGVEKTYEVLVRRWR